MLNLTFYWHNNISMELVICLIKMMSNHEFNRENAIFFLAKINNSHLDKPRARNKIK